MSYTDDLRNQFPERTIAPLWRARTYIDRKLGMRDDGREQRAQRAQARAPRSRQVPPVQTVRAYPTGGAQLAGSTLYRVKTTGQADTFAVKATTAAGAVVVGRPVVVVTPQAVAGSTDTDRINSLIAILRSHGIVV